MKSLATTLSFVLILILAGCDLVSPERHKKDFYYIIAGDLEVNTSLSKDRCIFIGKTINLNESLNEMFFYNEEMSVKLQKIDNNENVVDESTLQLNINFTNFDSLGYYDPSAMIIEPKTKYRLVVIVPDSNNNTLDTLWAETITPSIIEFSENPAFTNTEPLNNEDFPILVYDTANIDHPLIIRTENANTINLKYKYYCMEELADAYYIHEYPLSDDDQPAEEEDYEDPVYGSPRKIEWFMEYKPEIGNDGSYYVTDRAYKSSFVFWGRYCITLSSIDTNYYKYLYSYEGYKKGGIRSSANNAYGYFGSSSSIKLYTKVVE
ncbi:MAG: hypothetical protein PHR06_00330 [Candidatus Cloacimonetes bacterium]|nr:hypothetical protein [Candidatus Cloacimonadota bacterium]